MTLVLTDEQRRHVYEATGVSVRALKVTSELEFERAIEERKLRHVQACRVAAVDLR
jgi:hypothetical protein